MPKQDVHARIFELVREFHPSTADALAWFNTPHTELNERSPLEVMVSGRAEVVWHMLEAARLGLPT